MKRSERRERMSGVKNSIMFGDRIEQGERIEFFSLFEFPDTRELFAFLNIAKEYGCDVYFRNEDIFCGVNDKESMTNLKITMYMTIKQVPEIREAYNRYVKHEEEK